MLKQRHQLMVSLLALSDAVAIAAATIGAWGARQYRFDEPGAVDLMAWVRGSLILITLPVAMYTMLALKQYRPRRDKRLLGELGQILRASMITVTVVIVGLWAVGGEGYAASKAAEGAGLWHRVVDDPTRYQLALFAAGMPLLLGSQRMAFRLTLRWLRERGRNLRHVAVIGVGRLGQITARTLSRNSWTGLSVAYHVSHHPKARRRDVLGRPVQGGLEELETVLEQHPVDAVYLALPNAQSALVPDLLKRLERFAVDVRIVPDVHPRFLPQSMKVHELEGMPILSYRECPTHGFGGVAKRTLDLVGALVAILVFSPVMLLIALTIKCSDRGPVMFRQQRVSLGGDTFRILKFRTMRDVADEAGPARWTERGDDRITPLGRWLRSTSLDELPQLFNVLRGEMSLVGPRPERPELIARFREDWRGYMLRQHVKAGMTGWAQIHGLRGETSLRKRIQYDLHYVRHWSVWFDLRILAMTVLRGFAHPNAH